jgi:hypothetical protein
MKRKTDSKPQATNLDLIIMPGEPLASYPRKNAQSDVFDCLKQYIRDIPDGEEHHEAMRSIVQQPYATYAEMRIWEAGKLLHSRNAIVAKDGVNRDALVVTVAAINERNGHPGETIHDDVKQLCDLYARIGALAPEDWTEGAWQSTEWLLNDISRYYQSQFFTVPNHRTDEQEEGRPGATR